MQIKARLVSLCDDRTLYRNLIMQVSRTCMFYHKEQNAIIKGNRHPSWNKETSDQKQRLSRNSLESIGRTTAIYCWIVLPVRWRLTLIQSRLSDVLPEPNENLEDPILIQSKRLLGFPLFMVWFVRVKMMFQSENETKRALEAMQSKGGRNSHINWFSLGFKDLELISETRQSIDYCTRFWNWPLLTRQPRQYSKKNITARNFPLEKSYTCQIMVWLSKIGWFFKKAAKSRENLKDCTRSRSKIRSIISLKRQITCSQKWTNR